MASLWLRLYTETLNDHKVQKLPGELFKAWINILCVAKEYDHEGNLPPIDDLAFSLRFTRDVTVNVTRDLLKNGLLSETEEEEVFTVHGWENRQYPSDTDPTALERKRRQRNKIKDVTEMSRVTSRTSHGPSHGDVTRTEKRREEKEKKERDTPIVPFLPSPKDFEPETPTGPPRNVHHHTEVNTFFTLWNSLGLPEFRKLLVNVPNAGELLEALSFYTTEEIESAIQAYSTVQTDPSYDMGFHYQNVVNFLIKGLESFAPGAKPLEVYRAKGKAQSEEQRVEDLLARAAVIEEANRVQREGASA